MKKSSFAKGFALMLLVSAVTLFGYNRLLNNQLPYLTLVDEMNDSGKSMILDSSVTSDELSGFLIENGYLEDMQDAKAIAACLTNRVKRLKNGKLNNLGQLNSEAFRIPSEYIDSAGGISLLRRLEISKENIGVKDNDKKEVSDPVYRSSDSASCQITVNIASKAGLNVSGVPVRLKHHFYDKIDDSQPGVIAADSIMASVRTNSDGKAVFYVEPGYYSVVPVEPGYEFGVSKGSTFGELKEGKKYPYSFDKCLHSINSFSSDTFKEIKQDDALTVRSSDDYIQNLKICIGVLLSVWWISFIVIGIYSRKKNDARDMIVIPIVMLLNIISILVLFGMPNPVSDRMLGVDMTIASVIGVCLMTLASFIRVAKIYSNGYGIFNKRIPFEPVSKSIKGLSYLLLSVILMILLSVFGSAPGGSDAKINLFFFQPSELCKLLTVIFMAAFFAENSDAIRKFAEKTNKVTLYLKIRTISSILIAIFIISMMYMVILSDMGPALVLLITFVLMYSFARRDFVQLLAGIASFLATLYLFRQLLPATPAIVTAALTWTTVWIAAGLLWKKTIYESAVFFNLLIVLFMTGSSILNAIGLDHQAARLLARMSMFGEGVWDNNISSGGDQVAQALWGYGSGGFSGQGLGLGNSNLIPAGNTDLFFASIGEQLGFFGLVIVIVCMVAILYRAYVDGKNSGNPFSFYLATGIGSVTIIQFFIISFGSVGLIPLTGIAVPFLSFAKTSLVINLIAVGILIAVSKENAGHYQRLSMQSNKRTLVYGFLSYLLLGGILLYTLAEYMIFNRDETILHTGIFSNSTGFRSYHYNPRIKVLENKLKVESIYDRNGLPLASSSKDEIIAASDNIIGAGVSEIDFYNSIRTKSKRYYPFGMHTFFMVGDYNNKIQWTASINNPYGFNAENIFLSRLRGFNNQNTDTDGRRILNDIDITTYRPNRFLPEIDLSSKRKEMRYDYSQLLPLLKQGIAGHREIKSFDLGSSTAVYLTLDARLQTNLQNRMGEYIVNDRQLSSLTKLRTSVVILDCKTGDLLCSANYPLPQLSLLDSLQTNSIYIYNEKDSARYAYTDRDLGLTYQTHPGSTAKIMTALAGYHKYGNDLANTNYDIDLYEIIENGRIREPYSAVGGKSFRNKVSMTEAIVKSSNCYFINLLAEKKLYSDLGLLFETVGVRLDGHEDRGPVIPYFFYSHMNTGDSTLVKELSYLESQSDLNYSSYKKSGRSGKWYKMNRFHGSADYWGIAYGQGELYASPLNMARIGSIVANDGEYVPTRYELTEPVSRKKIIASGTSRLSDDMMKEADKHRNNGFKLPNGENGVTVLSKTGTPERTWIYINSAGESTEEKPNDGWYLFVIKNQNTNQYLSIAIRMERLGSMGSRTAVRFATEVVLPTLQQNGYQVY